MQTKLMDGSVMVCGGCSCDAELQYVGSDNKRLCKVGVAVGKVADPAGGERQKTKWCNVVAWHDMASILSQARKGDAVLAIGRLKTRTYNDKEYADLVAEYISVASVHAQAESAAAFIAPQQEFAELTEDDGELPF